jgi:hypothetical protein
MSGWSAAASARGEVWSLLCGHHFVVKVMRWRTYVFSPGPGKSVPMYPVSACCGMPAATCM